MECLNERLARDLDKLAGISKCFCNVKAQGGDFPQSLPVCVVKIWREMGPFSIHIGTGGVRQYGHVSHVIRQYGYNF